ncbi:MAG TPA: peptidoglycan-binding protein [Luteimonas sp.]|nr:peptidoglycan-binding protein [Luteimonas sp.]
MAPDGDPAASVPASSPGGIAFVSAGGMAASHPPLPASDLCAVAPRTDAETNTLGVHPEPIACWRVEDARFEFDSSMVLPAIGREARVLAKLRQDHAATVAGADGGTVRILPRVAIFGHADPVGDDEYNKRLSGRRAKAVYALLTKDPALWEALYSSPHGRDDWGLRAVQTMLAHLQGGAPAVTGRHDAATDAAVRDFQGANGLAVDGKPGPRTRERLFRAYMDALCGPGFRLDPAQDFLAAGADPGGKGDYHGCGEFNPVLLFSRNEQAGFANPSTHPRRNAENAPNRRVLLLLFEPGTRVEAELWPCPRAEDGTAGCRKRLWSDARVRSQTLSDAGRRTWTRDGDTFACRFYHRLVRHSPCEGDVLLGTTRWDIAPMTSSSADGLDFDVRPSHAPPSPPPPRPPDLNQPVLAAELLAITLDGGIAVQRAGAVVAVPHWEPGQDVRELDQPGALMQPSGSRRPAACLAHAAGRTPARVRVTVRITRSEGGLPGALALKGDLDGLQIEGACPSHVGEHVVEATIRNLPETARHVQGDCLWRLEHDGQPVASLPPTTRLEWFILHDRPGRAFASGVWAEALRFVFDHARVGPADGPRAAIARIADHCHRGHGLHYDTRHGAPHFDSYGAIGGGSFELRRYLTHLPSVLLQRDGSADDGRTVNCYDQAAAVQVLATAIGLDAAVFYLSPFGCILPTDLVGVGNCNNPFFAGNGSAPVTAPDDPRRTAFANHAFAHLAQRVEDACAGPHHDEPLRAYLQASVDVEHSRRRRFWDPGTQAPIDYLVGRTQALPGVGAVR